MLRLITCYSEVSNMGYYDDHMRSTKKNRKWLMPSVVGALIGAVLILLALPILVQANWLPYDFTGQENEETQESTPSGDEVNKQVNLEVNSQITEIVEDVSDTVVGVVNIKQQSIFGQSESQQGGVGSGVVYKKNNDSAFIVTNYHVIQGADSVEVVFADEEQVEAEIIGGDVYTDLAVLKVDGEHVEKVIEMGNSENLKVGEPVLAIGNPLGLQFAGTVTQGIISGKDRLIPQDFDQNGNVDWQAEVIQTDAPINPGNSGGALVNMDGQLIGINSMKYASPELEGLGFAIPIDIARPLIEDLEEDGTITRSYMGVEIFSLSDVAQYHWQNTLKLPRDVEGGVIIDGIDRMSPADQAGFQQYDVIVKMGDTEVQNVLELRQYLFTETSPGDEVKVTFYRDGELQETTVKLVSQSN